MFSRLDRYLLMSVGSTLISVLGIVVSLMLLEHLPRLLEIVRLSDRKATVIVQSLVSLLPEYAGIGLLFGLYLAVGLTVRRLSLRGEFDIIEASGVPPRRWMRAPMTVAVLVAGLLLWSQGWLMPRGERSLADLGRMMEDGAFGYHLEGGNFIGLGKGVIVRFERVDRITGELGDVFIQTGDTTFTASRGRMGFDLGGDVLVDLADGRSIDRKSGRSLAFARFHLDSGGRADSGGAALSAGERRKITALPALFGGNNAGDRAAAWSRLLWPVFALLIPFLAVVLGKPERRSSGSLGLMVGGVLLVLFIRTADLVATSGAAHPEMVAAATLVGWTSVIGAFLVGERRWGAGYVDGWLRRLAGRVGKGDRRIARVALQPPYGHRPNGN